MLTTISLHGSQREVDDLSDRVAALIPQVSIMSDLATHGLKVDGDLLAACDKNFAEGNLPCEVFIIEIQKRQFDRDIKDTVALTYIKTIKSSDQLLFEGWREKNRDKWDQGLELRRQSLSLLSTALGTDRN